MLDHKILYNSESISDEYAKRDYLEGAESAIIKKFGSRFKKMDMLDMGVGGGRTTKYFAPLVKSYIGADYAPNMITRCRVKYRGKYSFMESDVRSMNMFGSNMFDFVLFSYNGIDSFSHEDRFAALKEIKRVLRSNGYLYFSSHNLNWENLSDLFNFKSGGMGTDKKNGSRDFIRLLGSSIKSGFKKLRLNILNRNLRSKDFVQHLKEKQRGLIYDNSLNGKASVYYITRAEQIRQLEDAGFKNITTYSRNGTNTGNEEKLNEDGWIYYLCEADK
ncbi:MAG: class I SAM-dependent methyltransferase [Actinomycetota bacterium]|nr:class I SAM-dependent methyltransferase [Actinomycetota bacterium]